MPKLDAVTRLDGHVLSVRTINVEARQGTPATETRPAREPRPAFSYVEVEVVTEVAAYDGRLLNGVTAIQKVVTAADEIAAQATEGERVSWYCVPKSAWRQNRGDWFTIAALRFVAPVPVDARATA